MNLGFLKGLYVSILLNKKRLEYLESLKEDVEKGSNGDLVLNLTSILADVKNENQRLKAENRTTKEQKEQVKKDKKIVTTHKHKLNPPFIAENLLGYPLVLPPCCFFSPPEHTLSSVTLETKE